MVRNFMEFQRFKLPAIECGAGWHPLLHETLTIVAKIVGDDEGLEIIRIKEKYARLVIEFVARSGAARHEARIEEIVSDAEDRSATICDQCGAPGQEVSTSLGYLMTRCEVHRPRHQVSS